MNKEKIQNEKETIREPFWEIRDLKEVQEKSALSDDYNLGLYNGMELCLAILEKREPKYKDLPQADKRMKITCKEASIKYGFQEPELREYKRKGLLNVDKQNKFDVEELDSFFKKFWDEHISRTEMNGIYIIKGTRFTRLIKDGIIIPRGKYYDRKSFLEFVEQEKTK